MQTIYIEKYLQWKATHTEKACVSYRAHLLKLADLVRKDLEDITVDDIVAFQQRLKGKFAISHVSYITTVIKNFFEFWLRQGIKCVDPYLIRVPRFSTNSHAAVTGEEFAAIDASLPENNFDDLQKKVIVNILWDTGMRVSEVCDLDVANIDSQSRKTMVRTKKNRKINWVMWSEDTHKLLLKYLGIRICLNQRPALFAAMNRHNHRDRITPRTVQRWVKEVALRVGIKKKISPHSFRHGKAHDMMNRGANVKDIQAVLRHSEDNPKASFNYMRLSEPEFERIAQKHLRREVVKT